MAHLNDFNISFLNAYCLTFPVFLKPPVGGEPGARSLPSLLAALIVYYYFYYIFLCHCHSVTLWSFCNQNKVLVCVNIPGNKADSDLFLLLIHIIRVRTVMKNLEKSWNFKTEISRPGKVLEK